MSLGGSEEETATHLRDSEKAQEFKLVFSLVVFVESSKWNLDLLGTSQQQKALDASA